MTQEAQPPARAARWRRSAAAGLTFRRMTDADLPFCARLYASTRADELAPVPWSADEKASFLDMQFRAQHLHYRQHFADADWLVILRAGEPAGRLYLRDLEDDLHVIDIAFLPQHRRLGLGSALMQDLLDEAAAGAKGVTIHVEKNNPAMRLYRRLGFTLLEDQGVYDFMRSIPPAQVNTAS